MTLTRKPLQRVFRFNGVELQDPFPDQPATSDSIRRAHAAIHPPITNSKIDGPTHEGDKEVWTYTTNASVRG